VPLDPIDPWTDETAAVDDPTPPGTTGDGRSGADDPGCWVAVCAEGRIVIDTGVAAWVAGQQVALFRLADGSLRALDNHDPASGANVLARGIVGDSDARPVVASPVFKQRYDLATGACLDDPGLAVRTWDVRSIDGVVSVRAEPPAPDRPR
jgi:nitrite reductase (NADH) small subunit